MTAEELTKIVNEVVADALTQAHDGSEWQRLCVLKDAIRAIVSERDSLLAENAKMKAFTHGLACNGGWLETLTHVNNLNGESWCNFCHAFTANQQTAHRSGCQVGKLMDEYLSIVRELEAK